MQPAQNSTLQRILSAAAEEFSRKGFRSASLRSIAAGAGVTTGAFYGYFKSKDQLFDALVGKQYRHLLDLYYEILHGFTALTPQQQQTGMEDQSISAVNRMTDYIYDNLPAFQLILTCSQGTRYENLVHDMAMLDVEATHNFAKTMVSSGVPIRPVEEKVEHMLTSGMFSAYFEIVIHGIPRQEADKYIGTLLEFYSAGWQKIMGF